MAFRWATGEWCREDGTSCVRHFDNGQQTGAWNTNDKHGQAYKVTMMKAR